MTAIRRTVLALCALVSLVHTHGADPAAMELISAMLATRDQSAGELIRARLVVPDPALGRDSVVQLQIKIRRDAARTRRLYQVLWPKTLMGEALHLETTDDGNTTGFLFAPPDTVTPLTFELRASAFLGSDLSVEDLIADFWQWPEQAVGGVEEIGGERCTIIESRSPPGRADTNPLVRSWIAPTRMLLMRVDKLDAGGRVLKRLLFKRPVQRDRIWTPRVMIVQAAGAMRETTLEITRGERDVEVPPESFTLDAIKALASGRSPKSQETRP